MGIIIFFILLYLLYALGKFLLKVSKKLENYEESTQEYHQRLLNGVETIASNSSPETTKATRLDSLKEANRDLVERQRVRKMIDEVEKDLNIE